MNVLFFILKNNLLLRSKNRIMNFRRYSHWVYAKLKVDSSSVFIYTYYSFIITIFWYKQGLYGKAMDLMKDFEELNELEKKELLNSFSFVSHNRNIPK